MNRLWLVILPLGLIIGLAIYFLAIYKPDDISRSLRVGEWIRRPADHPDWIMQAGKVCGDAPFQFPSDGFIGFLWDDSFRPGHRHQGIDIFSGTGVGETAVFAVYDGYLTRLSDWKSSVIIRIPVDPLDSDRQIWTYFTHMADELGNSLISTEFPPGTSEQFIKAGTLLGYQGDYSGDPNNPVGVHLHFSIVLDDGSGKFTNELEISNTLDPSPYFNMTLNAHQASDEINACIPANQAPQP